MKVDPRHKNRQFSDSNDMNDVVKEYASWLEEGLLSVNATTLNEAVELLKRTAESGNKIYIIGNGGSAAVADHMAADLTKGTYVDGEPRVQVISLASQTGLYTAAANDFDFENGFSKQLELYAQPDDVLIAISSSGTSKNIVNALRFAKQKGLKVIGLSGFTGGELNVESDLSLYTPMHNYGVVEDVHQALLHIVMLVILKARSGVANLAEV